MDFFSAENFIIDKLSNELPTNLYYHGLHHTRDTVSAVERLGILECVSDADIILLKTAMLYHDSGFIHRYEKNEEIGAQIAANTLPLFNYSQVEINLVCELIMVTSMPHRPDTLLEKIVCDADLDYLGRDDFYQIAHTLKRELDDYGIIMSLKKWYYLQIGFLAKHSYFTESAIKLRQKRKEEYITEIKDLLNLS